jgi:hypothetical protein
MCEVRRCRGDEDVRYYGHYVCFKCWTKHCSDLLDLRKEFKIVEVV